MNQYNIYYSGGSGGYFFYYGLCKILGYDTSKVDFSVWDTSDFAKWKDNESLLDIDAVKLYCNERLRLYNAVLIYTDINTQLELAKLKHAKWYYPPDSSIEKHAMKSYYAIKDSEWPDINNINDFNTLPQIIIDECIDTLDINSINNIDTWRFIDVYTFLSKFNNVYIDTCTDIINDISLLENIPTFLLQDVIKYKFQNVIKELNLPAMNLDEYVDHWVSLHPPHIQELLLKDPHEQ